MKSIMLMAFFSFCHLAGAATNGSVHSIVRSDDGGPHLVKMISGEVVFVDQNDERKLQIFEKQIKQQFVLENKSLPFVEPVYTPTPVQEKDLGKIFKNMNPFMKRKSECSDRAHVWSWDEFERSGIQSEKAFLLLTDTYIKRHRYKWWFHVAPMFTTTSGKKFVMDKQFLDRPVTFEQWKNFLVFSKRECVTDFRFLDYDAGADQTQDCYVKFEPMYYYIPGEIGARENGKAKTNWYSNEVNASRSRAFFKGSL
jgi:hypothetical protein